MMPLMFSYSYAHLLVYSPPDMVRDVVEIGSVSSIHFIVFTLSPFQTSHIFSYRSSLLDRPNILRATKQAQSYDWIESSA